MHKKIKIPKNVQYGILKDVDSKLITDIKEKL